ncbi:hypothetical protein DL769_010155 [Monosporascus sp. CRB-8-3]|nr:hypothetical protein DL769_010155 [Monosporascus sp. CRB-8-3]
MGRVPFGDRTHLNGVDRAIFGIGYLFSLLYPPDAQTRVKKAYRRLPEVYQHAFNIEDPTLTFVGVAVAVTRYLVGRAKKQQLPVAEQLAWERRRVVQRGGGKDFYSVAPDFEKYSEFLRAIAGDPEPGATGRVLPPFDKKWLEVW